MTTPTSQETHWFTAFMCPPEGSQANTLREFFDEAHILGQKTFCDKIAATGYPTVSIAISFFTALHYTISLILDTLSAVASWDRKRVWSSLTENGEGILGCLKLSFFLMPVTVVSLLAPGVVFPYLVTSSPSLAKDPLADKSSDGKEERNSPRTPKRVRKASAGRASVVASDVGLQSQPTKGDSDVGSCTELDGDEEEPTGNSSFDSVRRRIDFVSTEGDEMGAPQGMQDGYQELGGEASPFNEQKMADFVVTPAPAKSSDSHTARTPAPGSQEETSDPVAVPATTERRDADDEAGALSYPTIGEGEEGGAVGAQGGVISPPVRGEADLVHMSVTPFQPDKHQGDAGAADSREIVTSPDKDYINKKAGDLARPNNAAFTPNLYALQTPVKITRADGKEESVKKISRNAAALLGAMMGTPLKSRGGRDFMTVGPMMTPSLMRRERRGNAGAAAKD